MAQVFRPVHSYHLGKAETDGGVLDVLANYERVDPPKEFGARVLWVFQNLAKKRTFFPDPFRSQCVAMVVCQSRQHVLDYVHALRSIAEKEPPLAGSTRKCFGIYGFFSGAIGDEQQHEEHL